MAYLKYTNILSTILCMNYDHIGHSSCIRILVNDED